MNKIKAIKLSFTEQIEELQGQLGSACSQLSQLRKSLNF